MSAYVADKEIVDVDDWEGERTAPGPVRSMGELAAECEAMALVRAWLDEQEVANGES